MHLFQTEMTAFREAQPDKVARKIEELKFEGASPTLRPLLPRSEVLMVFTTGSCLLQDDGCGRRC